MRLINSYVEWIKKVNAKKEEEEKKTWSFSFPIQQIPFHSLVFSCYSFKSFSVQKIEIFHEIAIEACCCFRLLLKHFSNYANMTFFCVEKKGFYFMFFPSCNWMDIKERTFFSVKHHNEPHYMKVIIFRDEIWFHDILTIKHKKITLWTCSFSLGRTV